MVCCLDLVHCIIQRIFFFNLRKNVWHLLNMWLRVECIQMFSEMHDWLCHICLGELVSNPRSPGQVLFEGQYLY